MSAVGKREVTYLPSGITARVPDGTTVFNAAHWAGLPIDSTCGGRGTCGKCGVRVVSGAAERTLADYRHLTADLDDGWRLSCQCVVGGDMVVEVPRLLRTPKAATMGVGRFVLLDPNVHKAVLEIPAPTLEDARSYLRRILDGLAAEGWDATVGPGILPMLAAVFADEPRHVTATVVGDHLVRIEAGDTAARMFGVSIDVGTTTVVATLLDLGAGTTSAVASTINRQAPYGADVIARMGYAMQDDDGLERLREAAVETVNALLDDVRREACVDRDDVVECVVVGNATMLHLLLGVHPRSIAVSPFVATFVEPLDLRAGDVGIDIHPEGRIAVFPSLGAYVGADIVSDVLATGLARDVERRLLVDVGTNGEIVCGNAERSTATAAPAGPAFEGGQIVHGMRATDGAIEGVTITRGSVELQVIGGPDAAPAGICGSGLIDAVAQLRLAGILDERGTLAARADARAAGHPLADRLVERDGVRAFALTDDVVLTQLDVRELQSAKGAISTGIDVVMADLGLVPDDLDEVLLAGSFGTYINPLSARVIGLVPPVPVERIKAVGNTASEGAKMALMSFREREVAFELPAHIRYLELSGAEDFNDRFIRNLAFPRLSSVADRLDRSTTAAEVAG
jgi:uncharacterized 2Fe-2S/4Fe-4S cluster protein (DUF4445 family)